MERNSGPTARLLLLTTCGTSILTNDADQEQRRRINEYANLQSTNLKSLPKPEIEAMKQMVSSAREKIQKAKPAELRKLSAEFNSMIACRERWKPERIRHILLHTDTHLGKEVAEILASRIKSDGDHYPQLITARDLRTDYMLNFRSALAELSRDFEDLDFETCRSQGERIVFNLTAGFKSVNAYLQSLAMLYADSSVFKFDGSSELIEIPRIPIHLDETGFVDKNLDVLRRLNMGYRVSVSAVAEPSEIYFIQIDNEITKSVWGDVVWARSKSKALANRLLAPLSSKVKIANSLDEQFDKLEARRKMEINEALDEFSAYMDHGRQLLESRKFKKLNGNPVPNSTHELYAWSDGAAGRLFGHYDGGTFNFDSLSKHL